MQEDSPLFGRKKVRANFERAVASYDASAQLQREVAERMLEQLEYERIAPQRIADIGAGTGFCTRGLEQRFKRAEVIAVDLSEGMLQRARKQKRWRSRQRFLCGDAAALPLASDSVDLLFSNFTLQWCTDLPVVLAEFQRVLRPGGVLTFSTLGGETLHELRACWAQIDEQVHVNQFVDLQQMGDWLLQGGWTEPVTSVDRFTLSYPSVMGLMRDLKGLGATNLNRGRRVGLMGRSVLSRLESLYQPRDESGRVSATWEVVYGHAIAHEDGFARPEPFVLPLQSIDKPD